MAKKKWPHGFVSKAQWRFAYSKGAPASLKKWAHRLSDRNERQGGVKTGYRRLPRRKGARKR